MKRDYSREPSPTTRKNALQIIADYALEAQEQITPSLEAYVLSRMRERYAPMLQSGGHERSG